MKDAVIGVRANDDEHDLSAQVDTGCPASSSQRITSLTTEMLPVTLLERHPSNRPLGLNLEKIDQIKSSISQYGFYSNQPIVVRPINSHYQIVKGEHRFVAAQELGFSEVPCSVQEMTDAEALVQLIIGNIQTENKPLEIGLNAMEFVSAYERGESAKDYAEKTGVSSPSLSRYMQAAKVYNHLLNVCHMTNILEEDRKLAEIQKCPQADWQWLHDFILSNELSTVNTITLCQSVRDLDKAIQPEDCLRPWLDRKTILSEIAGQVAKGAKKGQGITVDDFANKVKNYSKAIKTVLDYMAALGTVTLYNTEDPFEYNAASDFLERLAKAKTRNVTDVGNVEHDVRKYISTNLASYAALIAKKQNMARQREEAAARETEISRINSLPYRLLVGKAEKLVGIFDESVDVIITSPPYNLGDDDWPMGGGGRQSRAGIGYQKHDDTMTLEDYITWQASVFCALYRVAKPGANFFYNHKPRTSEGALIHPMTWLNHPDNPWTLRQEIIWHRVSTHNHSASLFWPIDERIYWLTKGKPNLTEQPIGMPTIWEEFGPVPNTWHPAPFTIELPRMVLKAINAQPGQTVLDPFAGSCTTLKAALEVGCRAIGMDVSKDYLKRAAEDNGWEYYE
jgi:ParB/RepB/Spo0J family partition protein